MKTEFEENHKMETIEEFTEKNLPNSSDSNGGNNGNNGNIALSNISKKKSKLNSNFGLGKIYDLPIQQKELLIVGVSFASILVLIGAGGLVLFKSLQSQLLKQAEAETSVAEIQYNIKVDQMGFGFRGQSDNLAIVAIAKQPDPTPELTTQVNRILQNEIKTRNIEYATLVNRNLRIIASGNSNRVGQVFDPYNLVTEVLKDPRQIKTTKIIKWDELQKENPPLPEGFANQDALIRYTFTPVEDPATKQIVAVLVSGDIVNNKLPIVQNTLTALGGGYSGVYARKETGEITLATGILESNLNVSLTDQSLLNKALESSGQTVSQIMKINGKNYALAAKTIPNLIKEDNGNFVPQNDGNLATAIIVRGIPQSDILGLLWSNLTISIIVGLVILGVNLAVALLIAKSITTPIKNLQESTKAFTQGDASIRATIFSQDELGDLAHNFNNLADNTLNAIAQLKREKEKAESIAQQQQQQTDSLQQELFQLLSSVEDASSGNLTVRAEISAGQIGIVADFFNAIIENLRDIVVQVKDSTSQVNTSLEKDEKEITLLADESLKQAKKIQRMLSFVEQMAQSIEEVANNAQTAAEVARSASATAENGGQAMERTVENIVQLRETVAETAKKVKRLGESSQQISKVISLINQIALQTNLLAINASIEAARAGEEGRGFAVVAEEVGQLAAQSAMATKEIEQIVDTIQLETSQVVEAMEIGTTQVVEGTHLVETTKESLTQIVAVSRQIDELVAAISKATVSQTQTSEMVTNFMKDIAKVSQTQSDASLGVSNSLQDTFALAQKLKQSVESFTVES
jgi:twitching motility protein PilJ